VELKGLTNDFYILYSISVRHRMILQRTSALPKQFAGLSFWTSLALAFITALASFCLCTPPALAFELSIHEAITTESLSQSAMGTGENRRTFSPNAIKEIVEANLRTDDPIFQLQSAFHFDNENFAGGSDRLLKLKEKIIRTITAVPPGVFAGESARVDFGGALHTIQDFYAHSNWVELGHAEDQIDQRLGRSVFAGADGSVSTCPDNPGVLSGQGLSQLTSGYFVFDTLPPVCNVPPGKCRHGLVFACPDGINKDSPDRANFDRARSLALAATIDFLNQILTDPRVSGDAQSVILLFGQ
jgi:hypothetical protein